MNAAANARDSTLPDPLEGGGAKGGGLTPDECVRLCAVLVEQDIEAMSAGEARDAARRDWLKEGRSARGWELASDGCLLNEIADR